MEKIISVFQRNYDGDHLIRNEVVPGAEWVLAGEGVATRKFDGACCMMKSGIFYKRYDAKKGKKPPAGFIPAQPDPDINTGHWPGWLVVGDGPEDKWFIAACGGKLSAYPDGTYEAVGPHFQGNPEKYAVDNLVPHGFEVLPDCPRDFDSIREWLKTVDIEGVVFHHTDGRMAKVKKKDFGLKRQVCDQMTPDQCCGNCVHLICENRSGIGLCDMPLPIWADWKDQEPVTMSVDNGKLCPCHVRREKEKERP